MSRRIYIEFYEKTQEMPRNYLKCIIMASLFTYDINQFYLPVAETGARCQPSRPTGAPAMVKKSLRGSEMGAGRTVVLAAVLAASAGPSAALAQERVEQGHEIARTWCAGCHVVEPGGAAGSDAAPPLPVVAQDPSLSPDRLRAWLADPHPPMPNLSLTRDEIEALVAYIGSLRTQ
jgi:mono/diheme cytochrome c family protein